MEQTLLLIPSRIDEKGIAEILVMMLSKEWPLPLKTIHKKLMREYGRKASFQSTFRALNRLVQKQILVKQDLHYELNQEWLEQMLNFAVCAKFNYESKNFNLFVEDSNPQQYNSQTKQSIKVFR